MFKFNFKKILLFSSVIHLTIIGGLIFGWQFSSPKPKPRTVYTVKIVELPEERPKLKKKKTLKKKRRKERETVSLLKKRRALEKIRKKRESQRKRELREKEENLRRLEAWSKEKIRKPKLISSSKRNLIFLDIPKIPSWYIRLIHDKVYRNWEPPPGTEKEKAIIFFEINREGQILTSSIEKTSRFSDFDRAALEAVKRSNPLSPLPLQYKEKILRVHLTFKYEKN